MRKLAIILLALSATATVLGQRVPLSTRMNEKNILNHMDLGISVGTTGIGIDLAVPVTNYVRVRAGYSYMPPIKLHSNFPIETTGGGKASSFVGKISTINEMLESSGVEINSSSFGTERELMHAFESGELKARDYVAMALKPNMHQFKFLVDVMPFKHNKHWSVTAGFFVGSSNVGEAVNRDEETLLLKAVNLYNERYYKEYVANGFALKYVDDDGTPKAPGINDLTGFVKRNGLAGFPLGYFADGKKAMMIPGEDNTVRATLEVNKFRPYVGIGYNTHLSRNKKWNLNVDAGVLFITGARKVFVDNVYKFDDSKLAGSLDEYGYFQYESGIGVYKYAGGYPPDEYYGDIIRYYYDDNHTPKEWYGLRDDVELLNHVDLCNDMGVLFNGKVRDMVDVIQKLKVYPNVSVSVSYRLY